MTTIHGLRIYPQTLEVVPGDGAPIFVHGRLSEECSDLHYIFRPLAPALRGHVVATEFFPTHDEDGEPVEPRLALRERYGAALLDADLDVDVARQLVLLQGDDFARWSRTLGFIEGALLPVFRRRPTFDVVERVFYLRKFRLTAESWPDELRAILHMWDDIFWQLFTTERSDVDTLVRAHAGDPRLRLFYVELEHEYPDPSSRELRPATADAQGAP